MKKLSFSELDIIEFIKNDLPLSIVSKSYALKLYQFFSLSTKSMEDQTSSIEMKINFYHEIWNNFIKSMYRKYLPGIRYKIQNGIEFTPFTYLTTFNNGINFVEIMQLSEIDINYLNNLYNKYRRKYKNIFNIDNNIDIANLMINIALLPPIMQLYLFYQKAYRLHAHFTKTLYETFSNQTVELPSYETNIGLFYGYNFLSPNTYEQIGGREALLTCKELECIRIDLFNIDKRCTDLKVYDKTVICPECGGRHENINVEKDIVFFAHLALYPKLMVTIGFNYFDYYVNDLREIIYKLNDSALEFINTVKDAKCIILVEGATEETALPLLALKYHKPLAQMKIHVWNSYSKQKVIADFQKIKENFPEMRICALLDNDAKKEMLDLERMMKGKKDRYSLRYIEGGTFEDLIPIDYVLKAFNELYKLSRPIRMDEINQNKEILGQLEKKLYDNYAGKLDKVKFINKAISFIPENEIPNLIKGLIDDAYKLIGA